MTSPTEMDCAPEEWRIIPSCPEYAASSLGRIIRIMKKRGSHGAPLTGRIDRNGYHVVVLRLSGRCVFRQVNRLVCEAFHGPPTPSRPHAAHGDGVPLNNRPDNLRWASIAENAADRDKHGRTSRGSRHPTSKLSETDIPKIRDHVRDGLSERAIGKLFGVSGQTIRRIKLGEKWKHV